MKINLYKLLDELDGNGNDLQGGFEDVQDEKAKQIIQDKLDEMNGVSDEKDENDDVELPSDKKDNPDDVDNGADDGDGSGDKLYADKYKTIDELKSGIKNLNKDVPDYIIDGLNDDALEQMYLDERKKFSSEKKEERTDRRHQKEDKKPEDKPEDNKDGDEKDASKLGDLFNRFDTEFREGGISSELYDEFEKAGIPSNVVDKYADNLKLEQDNFTKNVLEIAGGEEEYIKIKAWAEDGNVPASQMKAMENMPYDQILLAMRGIKAQYDATVGSITKEEPKQKERIRGNSNNQTGSGYASRDEYLIDVKDKRYNLDKRFRDAVEKKLARSKFD